MDGGDQAGFGVVEGHVGDVLDVWPNEVVQQVQVMGGGGSERRVQSHSTPSEAKPSCLWDLWVGAKDCNRSWKLCFHHPGHVQLSGFAF